jgi:hypothetical protein
MKYVLLILVALNISELNAQLPMPCVNYYSTNFGELIQFHGWKSTTCLNINTEQQPGETPLSLSDNHSREFEVTEAVIEPGFSYTPGEDPSAQFSIVLGGNREDMSAVWFEPAHYDPQIYEKIEWGFQLPAEVEAAIDNWIFNDQNPTATPLTPALNPFDPDQIDLHAIIDYTTINGGVYFSQPVNGFFYRDYDRITAYHNPDMEDMSDVNDWYWRENQTDYRFRIRWASDAEAQHSVRVVLDVPTMGNWEMESFEFRSVWNDPRNSFISITNNQHYFKTADGHVYFPVGLNINYGTFGCGCAEGVEDIWDDPINPIPFDCAACYGQFDPAGNPNDDPCCGIRKNKRKYRGISAEEGMGVQGYTIAPAAYVKLEQTLVTLKNNGANSFRTLLDPAQYDIEFEKLNNYYDRQYQAWEFDQMINTCDDLDLRIELNMMIHYAITYHPGGYDVFDWDNTQNCVPCPGNDNHTGTNGFCYWNELGLNTPADFLSNTDAILNYQKKLRYMIARWGFSKNIFLFELLSEMNNIGVSQYDQYDDVDGDGQGENWWNDSNGILDDGPLGDGNEAPPEPKEEVKTLSFYDTQPSTIRPMVAAWHHEMARYIKENLHHTRHLIAADYTGVAPMDNRYPDDDVSPCQSNYFDDSWHSTYIDVIAFNNYNGALNRWEKMANHEYRNTEQTPGLMCGWDDPTSSSDNEGYHSALNSYESIWKPVIHPEEGYEQCMSEDFTGFVKDLYAGIFSGHATSGMSWDEWGGAEHWYYLGEALEFLNLHVLDDVDIGNELWTPNHVYSKSDPSADNCQFVEAVFLRRNNSNFPKFTGVILNRTWNNHSVCNCDSDDEYQFNGSNQYLAQSNIAGWTTDEIFLHSAGFHHYTIRYFDPYTKAQVNQVNRWSTINGYLGLEDYPLMHDGTNNHQPFYFFEAFLEGSEFDESPVLTEQSIKAEKETPQNQIQIIEPTLSTINTHEAPIKFAVFPSPGGDLVQLSCDPRLINSKIHIYSGNGQFLTSKNIDNVSQALDFSSYGAGIYFIVSPEFGLSAQFIKAFND